MKNAGLTIPDVQKGQTSASEVFSAYRKKIDEHKDLNAFITIFDEPDQKGQGPLAGVPCVVKDNMLIDGTRTTAGSKILDNYIATYDATVITRLKKAGAVFLGKTNMDDFAMGTSTENSAYGPVKNPHDPTRVPGGSSGGSAAAVAADLTVFALGSDTGGSVRQPASMCGVVGLKPTYGRVSRHGLIAMASSFDQIGPLTKTVRDAALVLNVIAGHDPFDATTVDMPVPDFMKDLEKGVEGLRVGMPKEFFQSGLTSEVKERIEVTVENLKNAGAKIVQISLPNFQHALAAYYILVPSEISANSARYDGIRYGHVTTHADSLLDVYMKSRDEGFGAEPKRRIMLGTYALSAGYYDAYYVKALKVRALVRRDFDRAFEQVDVIVGPTAPSTAFKLGEKSDDPMALYLEDIYTVPVNLAGLPAISVPCGVGSASGLPVGFQIIGAMFDESTVLQVAQAVEKICNPN